MKNLQLFISGTAALLNLLAAILLFRQGNNTAGYWAVIAMLWATVAFIGNLPERKRTQRDIDKVDIYNAERDGHIEAWHD